MGESMLDCIRKSGAALPDILKNWKQVSDACFQGLQERLSLLDEIIFVGSGTSNTAAVTARGLVEKVSGVSVRTVTPNEFLNNMYVYPENALYVFTSQTGTSIMTRQALELVKQKKFASICITESADTPMARESEHHLTPGCGIETYPMRTLGYCASVLVLQLVGMEFASRRGTLTDKEFDGLIQDAAMAASNIVPVVEQAMNWLDKARHSMLRAESIIFTGEGALYGVALEGAMKVWETPQIPSFGYEAEEGIHGPNYGYNSRHCVIALNDGGPSAKKLMALARYMKEVHGCGFVIGEETLGADDLKLELKSREFRALEFAPAVQCVAYHLAIDYGRSMALPHDNSRMETYFVTHSEPVGAQG